MGGNQPGFHEVLGLVQTKDSKQLAHARVRVTGLRHLLSYVSSFQGKQQATKVKVAPPPSPDLKTNNKFI